jgi:tetratricopeptide (TPR) repeat protein
MNTKAGTYLSSAYQAFCAIDQGDHRERIRYIEKNLPVLRELDVIKYLEVLIGYSDALFETGNYQKHIRIADEIIQSSIDHNIQFFHGNDVYVETLFKKAASLYNLMQIDDAKHILEEILRIDPKHAPSRLFLINCYVKKQKKKTQTFRGVSVALILLSAFVIAIELLVVRPFYDFYTPQVESLRNTLLLAGIGILVLGELWIRYCAVEKVYNFIREARKAKNCKDI